MSGKQRLRWQAQAIQDLETAHSYLFENSPNAACRFAQEIVDAAERLTEYPQLGAVALDIRPPGRYRSWTCGRFRLIYRIDKEVIWLLRVWDTRRSPHSLKPA